MKTDYSGEQIKQKLKTNLFQEFFTYTEKCIYYDKISRTSNKYFVRMWNTHLRYAAQAPSFPSPDAEHIEQRPKSNASSPTLENMVCLFIV